MADPPRKQPPPLPPRPLVPEPFINLAATGCCPFTRSGGLHGLDCSDLGRGRCAVDIGQVTSAGKADPMPDTVRTRRDELPPQPFDDLEELDEPPLTRGQVAMLRRELVLRRERLPPRASERPNPEPGTPSVPPKSRAIVALSTAGRAGQILTIAIGVLGIAAEIAAVFRPDLQGPIEFARQFLKGIPQ
jgi:hypothetical protein